MKSKSIVVPSEYINKDGVIANTIITARDKNDDLFVVCVINRKNILMPEKDFLENYDIAINGKMIDT